MAVVLGAGDSFHLVPRALALCTTGFDAYAVQLGLGKWITSITMTIFYVLLYYVWRERYQVKNHVGTTATIFALAVMRVALCMLPQNQWLTNQTPLEWGILRNIPFAIMGLMVIVLFYRNAKQDNDEAFRWMWLTIVLSFGFYIPVVLWAEAIPAIGMLMIPKTCAYVWTVLIGYNGHEGGVLGPSSKCNALPGGGHEVPCSTVLRKTEATLSGFLCVRNSR